MRQFKVYRNLTVGYNFAILLATIIVILGFAINANAQGTISGSVVGPEGQTQEPAATTTGTSETTVASPTGGTLVINTAPPAQTREAAQAEACRSNMKDLNDRIASLNSACAGTKLGSDCVGKLFQCHNGSGNSDECKQVNEYESSATRSEIDHKISKLKKERDNIEKAKEKLEDQMSDLQSEVDSLTDEHTDLQSEKSLGEEELREKLQENKSAAARKAEELQAGIEMLQQKIREIHVSSMDDANTMTKLIAESRVECLTKGKEKADEFVQKVRACTQNGGRCGVSQNTLFNIGKKSLQDLGNSYQANHVRKCMSVGPNSTFGVRFMALQAQINRKTQFMNQQQAELMAKQDQLQIQIRLIPNQNSIHDTQNLLEKAQKDQVLTQKEQALMMKQMQKAMQVTALKEKIEEQQQKLDKSENDILEQEKKKAEALSDDNLKRFKEALASISHIKNEAISSRSCGCEGPLKTLDRYAGGICDGTGSPSPATDDFSTTTE